MKKYLFVIILLFLGVLLNVTVYATEVTPSTNVVLDEELALVFKNQMSESDQAVLANSELDIEIENKPIIKIYNGIFWELSDATLDKILKQADQANSIDYIIFDEEPIRLRKTQTENEVFVDTSSASAELNFITDIQTMQANTEILGTQCSVINVYCFDMFSSHMGASIYFITTEGTFVKHYQDQFSDGVWFTEQEYGDYAIGYYNYISAPENNYDENGSPLGGTTSFLSYIDNYHNKASSKSGLPSDNIQENHIMPIIIIAFALLVIVGCVTAYISIAKRKK